MNRLKDKKEKKKKKNQDFIFAQFPFSEYKNIATKEEKSNFQKEKLYVYVTTGMDLLEWIKKANIHLFKSLK